MSRNVCVTLGTAIAAVAAGVLGCSHDTSKNFDSPDTPLPPAVSSTAVTPPSTPLPAAEALIDVLNRLVDPALPGNDKLVLVQGSGPETLGALDRFITAARDGGYLPMTFVANNVAWSSQNASNVMATVVVTTANPAHREFTFPMEFTPFRTGWQLSRKTADMLLAMQAAGTLPPTSPPPPAPSTPAPSASAPGSEPAPAPPGPPAGPSPPASPGP